MEWKQPNAIRRFGPRFQCTRAQKRAPLMTSTKMGEGATRYLSVPNEKRDDLCAMVETVMTKTTTSPLPTLLILLNA